MSWIFCSLFFALVLGCNGAPQSPHAHIPIRSFPGRCPDLQVSSNYEAGKTFAGVWYQVYATAGDLVHQNKSSKCIERRYNFIPGNPELGINKYSLSNRRPVWKDSKLIVTDKPGVFLHSRDVGQWYHQVEIKTIVSVPDSHLVMWGCMYDSNTDTHLESGGISSRHPFLSDDIFRSIQKVLNDANAAIKFEPVDWSDCRAQCE